MTLENKLGELMDIIPQAEEMLDHLRTAECVESESDFNANIDNAIDVLDTIRRELLALRKP